MAVPAALLIAVGEVKNLVTGMVNEVKSGFGQIKNTILDTVGAFRPFQIVLFQRAVMDLKAVFGQIFLPVLQTVTRYVRLVANYFYSLPPAFGKVLQSGAKIVIVLGIVASVIAAVAGLGPVLSFLSSPIGVLTALLSALGYAFAQTAGGGTFLKNVMTTVEQVLTATWQGLKAGWEALAPVRAQLSAALSDLGVAFNDLLIAAKPFLALGIQSAVVAAVFWLKFLINGIIGVVNAIRAQVNLLVRILNYFGANLKLPKLPDVARPAKDARGLAPQPATITSDVLGIKTKIEEMILSNTGTEEKKEDPIEVVAENTNTIADKLQEILDKMDKLIPSGKDVVQGAKALAPWNAGEAVGRALFGP